MQIKWSAYRLLMRLAHRYNWHYAPPIYPEDDTHLWCKWCGFRQAVKRKGQAARRPDGCDCFGVHRENNACASGLPRAQGQANAGRKP